MKPLCLLAATFLPLVTAHSTVVWTTTFTDSSAGANTGRNVINTPSMPFGDTLTSTWSLNRSGSLTPTFLTGTSNNANNFNPRQNVDNAAGAFWQSDFSFTGGSSTIDLSQVSFDIYRYNNAGAMQAGDSVIRTVQFSAFYTVDGGSTWLPLGTTQNVNTTASNIDASPANLFISLDFALAAQVPVDLANDDFRIRFRAENDASNAGANIGINRFTVSIPEPAAALFGGIGLLALLRRRRA